MQMESCKCNEYSFNNEPRKRKRRNPGKDNSEGKVLSQKLTWKWPAFSHIIQEIVVSIESSPLSICLDSHAILIGEKLLIRCDWFIINFVLSGEGNIAKLIWCLNTFRRFSRGTDAIGIISSLFGGERRKTAVGWLAISSQDSLLHGFIAIKIFLFDFLDCGLLSSGLWSSLDGGVVDADFFLWRGSLGGTGSLRRCSTILALWRRSSLSLMSVESVQYRSVGGYT